MPAAMEKVDPEGLALDVGSKDAAPMPIPIRLRISCVTRATMTPASTAPQEILLNNSVRTSSSVARGSET